ncbi:RIP metalloprotease RseP [Natranaerofaba carboxydovora]|uniref:RIP metalloprotease RseP n=1 Tax=Natranaerofaba carboxydovora TaxID=2742683 RepID=UPI001F13A27A|nr:RIP metalloprotease RseP [Natranaerofaba carboxydovora]UMZ73402.1 Regulator of sigma-W protease RasP [Natranaerofaba carboxydovora]
MTLTTIVYSIIVLGILIFVHEFGHFIVAKLSGVKVLEFALGFGPKLIGFKRDETNYSLRIIPLGGFCRMLGEDPDEAGQIGSFTNASPLNRIGIIAAGPLMNFILAVFLFFIVYSIMGVPNPVQTEIGEVLPGSEAEEAGLEPGDKIVSVKNEEVETWESIVQLINENPEQEIELTIERNGDIREVNVVPEEDPQTGAGQIGISNLVDAGIFTALTEGTRQTVWFTGMILVSLVEMVTGQVEPDVAGPVGIVHMIGEVAEMGLVNLATFAAFLSINLGLLNLLPIPALDGSRLLFILVEFVRGRPVDPVKEGFVHFIGFAILIMLMIIIAYQDLLRLDVFD